MKDMLGQTAFQPDAEEWAARPPPSIGGLERAAVASSVAPSEEAALIARARAGDQEAFGVLVRWHQRLVYALALRMLRNMEEASEATQEVFLAAWQGLHGFRGDARFATWLYRITYNYCLKVTQNQRRDSAARAALIEESARAQREETLMSVHLAQAAERDVREAVRDEIANLPPKYRAVLVLRHLQDFSYEEMAEIMRVPIGTVKTQLFRARALLKERLEDISRGGSESIAEGITGITEGIAQSIARAGGLRAEFGAGLRSMLERKREQPSKGEG